MGVKTLSLQVYKDFTFEAALRPLSGEGLFGYSFHVRVVITLMPGNREGADVARLDTAVLGVRAKLDHKSLNDIAGLEISSMDKLAVWIGEALRADLPGLSEVHLSRPSRGDGCIVTYHSQ